MSQLRDDQLRPESPEDQGFRSGLTVRSLGIGFLFVAFLSIGSIHASWVLRSTLLATNYFPSGFGAPLFIFVAFLNPLLKLIRKRWALSEQELAVIAIMGLCACAIPTYGMVGYLFSTTAAPFYFASPENLWAEKFHLYLPSWTVPTDRQALKWFFEGRPTATTPIPWSAWGIPLFWWLALMLAFTAACFCLLVMFRKQWMARERLTYPLAEIPLTMIKDSADHRLLPGFMRSALFWVGFGFISAIMTWNFVGYWVPGLPRISWDLPRVQFGQAFPAIYLNASPLIIGISFLLRLEVSFSIWFFYLIQNIQVGVFNKLGIPFGSSPQVYDSSPSGVAWQAFGGFAVLVISGFWLGRHHFAQIIRRAFGLKADEDDSNEALSYRAAFFGFVILSLFCVVWLRRSGMSWLASGLFVCFTYFVLIGLTRVIIDGGLVFVRPPLTPQSFVSDILGTRTLTPQTMTALGLSFAFYCDPIVNFMPLAANAMRIGHQSKVKGRSILVATVLSVVIALALSVPATIWIGYDRGAYNFREWQFTGHPTTAFNYVIYLMNNPHGTDTLKLSYMGGGMFLTAALLFLRYRYTWFPINPIGFPVAMVGQVTWTVCSIFIGWLIKFLILKLGGAKAYERAKPFFIGAVLAFLNAAVISYLIDWLFFPGGPSHGVYR